MRFLLMYLFLMSGAAFADACTNSPRPFWSTACGDPLSRAVTLEMEALISAVRDNPLQHPGTWAAHGMRAEMVYQQLNACQAEADPHACLLSVAAGFIAELRSSPQLPADYSGLSRAPVDLLCPAYARPFQLTRLDTDPALIWAVPGNTLLTHDPAVRDVFYGGNGADGPIELGITPSGQVMLTGLTGHPMPCMIRDEDILR
ncbi:hypothetical protein [Nioella aestuarii]|uniref:hypothetical protein n=1 Tax=Nioella aestuarii TaxID=1662864 RepID=UPI003D7F5617